MIDSLLLAMVFCILQGGERVSLSNTKIANQFITIQNNDKKSTVK